ncbi:MAG: DUF3783 domain-containing protein [Ruminococcus sp.]|nr:DUF3783 domain-containing protein [Ruminococcus sp.]
MKARHLPLQSAVIFGGFDDGETKSIRQLSERCGYKSIKAEGSIGGATIKSILAGKPDDMTAAVPDERFLIINGGGANAARLMDLIKSEGIEISLRAMVTLHSQEWTLCRLIDELISEHKEMSGQ